MEVLWDLASLQTRSSMSWLCDRNGRWRSVWTVSIVGGGSAEVRGLLKVQVHYYEDGNVQLVTSKECKETIPISVSSPSIALLLATHQLGKPLCAYKLLILCL